MTPDEFLGLMKQLGLGAAVLFVIGVALWRGGKFLGRIVEKFFEGLIDEMKNLRKSVDDHAKEDAASHGDTREHVVSLAAKLDGILDERDRTPVEGVPVPARRTHPRGVPAGYYGPRRGPTNGDDDR